MFWCVRGMRSRQKCSGYGRRMAHGEDHHLVLSQSVGHDVGQAGHDKLARVGDAADLARQRQRLQPRSATLAMRSPTASAAVELCSAMKARISRRSMSAASSQVTAIARQAAGLGRGSSFLVPPEPEPLRHPGVGYASHTALGEL